MRKWLNLSLLLLPLAVKGFLPGALRPQHLSFSSSSPAPSRTVSIESKKRGVILTSTASDGADYPSDTSGEDDDAPPNAFTSSSTTAGTSVGGGGNPFDTEGTRSQVKESLKCQIYKIAAKTNRGQLADLDQQNEMINLVAQLEAIGSRIGGRVDPVDIEGRWELVYSDVQPFRVSPFFMTVGKVMGQASQSAEDFFRLHRLATSGSEIGHVRQIITSTELLSEVEIKTGIPSIPFAITGTVVTRASAERTAAGPLRLSVKSTGVTSSNLFSFLDGGSLPELPLGDLAAQLGAYPPAVMMSTDYVDANMRISRTEDDHFFVFTRI